MAITAGGSLNSVPANTANTSNKLPRFQHRHGLGSTIFTRSYGERS